MISKIREKLDSLNYLIEEQDLTFEKIDENTFKLEGRIVFSNGYILDFMEYSSSRNHDYRFHLMDELKNLVTRWDNAPHHEELDNFPYHVHESDDVVEPDKERSIIKIFEEVESIIVQDL